MRNPRPWIAAIAIAAPLTLVVAASGRAAAPSHAIGGHDIGQMPIGTAAMASAPAALARIGFDAVMPPQLQVVTGESVQWTNDSARVHTVTADDDSFDSGRIVSGETYTHRFTVPGPAPYHCMLHPLIQGVVDVSDVLLQAPSQAAAPNRPYPLTGRTAMAAGTAVSIEGDDGAGFAPVATATVDEGGTFQASVTPTTTGTYRAVAGAATSEPVELLVLDRSISLSARRTGAVVRLSAAVTPATHGGRIVLQLYEPEHFGWWPVRTSRLSAMSAASFTLRTRRPLRARVRYTLADGATALATSRTLRIGPAPRHR